MRFRAKAVKSAGTAASSHHRVRQQNAVGDLVAFAVFEHAQFLRISAQKRLREGGLLMQLLLCSNPNEQLYIKLPDVATSHQDFAWKPYVAALRLNSSKQL